jgi:hypothetical protein
MTPPPDERPRETPAPKPVTLGPAIPSPGTQSSPDSLADVVAALESDLGTSPAPSRARTPTSQRFRQTNTGIGRLAANNTRRPQAAVQTEPTPTVTPARSGRRPATEVTDYEVETDVRADDWKNTLAVDVEEDQMLEWSAAGDETQTTDEHGRKR